MKLSIITINYNNAEGLRRTLASVAAQTYHDIEHIIIDGGSTDGSVDVIREYAEDQTSNIKHNTSHIVKWLSEPDKGIYNAMNHGIEIALGRRIVNEDHTSNITHNTSQESLNDNRSTLNESLSDYIQILNSGDLLAAPDVTERMMSALHHTSNITHQTSNIKHQTSNITHQTSIPILYGNMIKKDYTTGKIIGKSGEVEYSLRNYYSSTMNHDCCYIRRDLFDIYGLYDENLKIVSDWKWFLQAIGLGNVKPKYVDIDVTIFDASGVSETNLELRNKERRQVLEELLPPAVLADYDAHAFEIEQMNRLRRRHMYGLVYFIERVLFKLEKWGVLR